MNKREYSETKQTMNKYQVGDIVKFKDVVDVDVDLENNFLYKKRQNIWNDWNILSNQNGIVLEVRSIENTIKPEYQKYYRGKDWIPYLWYCFKTAKIYLIFQREVE